MAFLKGPAQSAHSLYILGDFFDYYVGTDVNTDFQEAMFTALRTLAQNGTQLFFISGNRDFLISSQALKKAQCQKLADPSFISLYGVPTLLTHGDKLCTEDIAYQRYRLIAQNPITRFLFLLLPKKIRQKIAQKLRLKSQRYQRDQTASLLDVTPASVDELIMKKQVKQLIHGHVHQPQIYTHPILGEKVKRVVLGDWHESCCFVVCTPEKTSLASFSMQNGVQIQASYALEEITAPLAV